MTLAPQTTESKLTFANASKRDEGNYTCSPSNSVPATVQLYVTKKSKHIFQCNEYFYDILWISDSFSADPVMKQTLESNSSHYKLLSNFVLIVIILFT